MSVRSRKPKTTRARGFAPWAPRDHSLALLQEVRRVLSTFQAYLPVTIRQIFYRLVATIGYGKTEKSYARLAEMLVKARRAGEIPWDAIRDDGFTRTSSTTWDDPRDWADAVLRSAQSYRLDRQTGQDRRLVVWCEAAGMVPQLDRVASEFSIPVLSSGGFDSVTAKYQAAREIVSLGRTTILHIGDLDPSGVHMFSSLTEDLQAFIEGLAGDDVADFVRLAVTRDQVDDLGLPTSPAKETDRRSFEGDTVQAEAIPPDRLAQIVRDAIDSRLDGHILGQVLDRERRERAQVVDHVAGFLESLK